MSKDQQDRLSYAILEHFQSLLTSKAVDGEAAESMSGLQRFLKSSFQHSFQMLSFILFIFDLFFSCLVQSNIRLSNPSIKV